MAARYCLMLLRLCLVAGLLAGASTLPSSEQAERSPERAEDSGSKFSIEAGPADEEWDAIASNGAAIPSAVVRLSNGTEVHVFPTTPELLHRHVRARRPGERVLGDFRQCSPCTCCDRSRRWCLPTVCCYNIRCGVRGLPFGVCSFIPVSCTCFGCRS